MERGLMMTGKDREKYNVMSKVKEKFINIKDAAQILDISYRQCRRIYKRYIAEGAKGIVHRARGKPSNHQSDEKFKKKVIARYQEKYDGFGPTLAAEKLHKEGLKVQGGTLRKWLIAVGIWQRRRKRKKYRQRRERKHHFGEMIQFDGSPHKWFENRGGMTCLMNMIDDATNKTCSILNQEETTKAAMFLLWHWVLKYGIPYSLYCDLKNVYITDREPTLEEQLAGKKPLTAFGKACEKLGIIIIKAYSAQAKGRVERNHGVYQDRFVKELRLEGISNIAAANKILAGGFIDEINEKFSIKPKSEKNMHRPVPKNLDLRTVFCWETQRMVGNDWVVRYKNRYFQITRDNKNMPGSGRKVTVAEWLDGSIHILHQGKELRMKEIGIQALKEAANQ